MTASKYRPGAWVHLVPDTSAHKVLGDRAQLATLETVPSDCPNYVCLMDPEFKAPRICLRDHIIKG